LRFLAPSAHFGRVARACFRERPAPGRSRSGVFAAPSRPRIGREPRSACVRPCGFPLIGGVIVASAGPADFRGVGRSIVANVSCAFQSHASVALSAGHAFVDREDATPAVFRSVARVTSVKPTRLSSRVATDPSGPAPYAAKISPPGLVMHRRVL
jgi:hypothetical protein